MNYKKTKVAIIEYGVGNTHSVQNALNYLGYTCYITNGQNRINDADVVILPGVGAFEKAMQNIEANDLIPVINATVKSGVPVIGICVGMQVLADYSWENGKYQGLGIIPGEVVPFPSNMNLPIPHVGWNSVSRKISKDDFLPEINNQNFYFDHSYYYKCEEKYIVATSSYGVNFPVIIKNENVIGIQCHPEKSQNSGLKLFRSIINWSIRNA